MLFDKHFHRQGYGSLEKAVFIVHEKTRGEVNEGQTQVDSYSRNIYMPADHCDMAAVPDRWGGLEYTAAGGAGGGGLCLLHRQ